MSLTVPPVALNGLPGKKVFHKELQPFFEKVNNYPLKVTKAVWGLTPVFQVAGLVNERAAKLARAFYGTCWSIVYSCYRPWTPNRTELPEDKAKKKIPDHIKTFHNVNEHFRFGMGSLVSLVYGGGAFGMLYSWLKGDDDLFDKSANVYQIGMFNQNQVFASMNATDLIKREYLDEGLSDFEKDKKSVKSRMELIDTWLFIPSIITRAIDSLRLFGKELGETTQKIVNVFSYIGYGTWAARYGFIKQLEDKTASLGNGLLDKENPKLKGSALKVDNALRTTQKYGGKLFYTILPGLSWFAAGAEALGARQLAEGSFKLEGMLERLNPAATLGWCGRNTWMKLFEEKDDNIPAMTTPA